MTDSDFHDVWDINEHQETKMNFPLKNQFDLSFFKEITFNLGNPYPSSSSHAKWV